MPLTPMSVQGDISIDGDPAPVGTVVTAEIDGEQVDSYTVQSAGQYMLTIAGESDDDGKTIEFFINGENADKTENWESGTIVTLNLAISISDDNSVTKSSSSFSSGTSMYDEDSESEDSSLNESYDIELDAQDAAIENDSISSETDSSEIVETPSSSSKATPGFTSMTLIFGLIVLCIGANRK